MTMKLGAGQPARTPLGASTRRRTWLLACVATCLLTLLASSSAWADDYVIKRGREAEVVALFAPYKLGGPPVDGWQLHSLNVEAHGIEVTLVSASTQSVQFVLEHPSRVDSEERTPSFAIVRGQHAEQGPGAEVVDEVIAAVAKNDPGGFWDVVEDDPDSMEHLPLLNRVKYSTFYWIEFVLEDGLVRLGVIASILLALVLRLLRGAPARIWWGLGAALAISTGLRLWMATPMFQGPWPYSRVVASAGLIYKGFFFHDLNLWHGGRAYLTDVILAVNLGLGIITPLAVFAHAQSLLKDHAVAVACAAMIAVLPSHIRFTPSEIAFISSIVISSTAFALLHTAIGDGVRWVRWAATLAFPVVMASMLQVRPLNTLFLPLLLGIVVVLRRDGVPRSRRVLLGLLTAVGGGLVSAWHLATNFGSQVREGLSLHVLWDAFKLLGDPVRNTLLNPTITPPPLMVFMLVGGLWLWHNYRAMGVFLLAWLLLFHTGHAAVISDVPAFQARYYLHLAVPAILLAAAGVRPLWRFHRRLTLGLGALLLVSPLTHAGFIRDLAYNEMAEVRLLERMRTQIPQGCSVIEYLPEIHESRYEPRLSRMGEHLFAGEEAQQFHVLTVPADRGCHRPDMSCLEELVGAEGMKEISESSCLYVYEGIGCLTHREPDGSQALSCRQLRESLDLQTVDEEPVPGRYYHVDWPHLEDGAFRLAKPRGP